MKTPIHLAEYLFRRIRQVGIRSVHGVPSDYNLALLDYLPRTRLHWVGNCNELNAGYAADGYARVNGLSALITTIGVGELSTLNAIAGAFSEQVPIIHIVGHPSTISQRKKLPLHHTLGNGDFDVFTRMSSEISCAVAKLEDIKTAPAMIDDAIKQAWRQSRPVYIGLPTDLVQMEVDSEGLEIPLDLSNPSAADIEDQVVDAVLKELVAARKPVIVVDIGASQFRALHETRALVQATGLPTFVMPAGRGVVNENDPQFGGVYGGIGSSPGAQKYVESADLVVRIGLLKSDLNTSGFTDDIDEKNIIEVVENGVVVRGTMYSGVHMKEVLHKVVDKVESGSFKQRSDLLLSKARLGTNSPTTTASLEESNITHDWLWPTIGDWLREGDVVIAEAGTSSFGTWGTKFPKDATYVSQHRWASIGFTVGACQGAALAVKDSNRPNRRTILFVGDGSFQLTGQEVSTMLRNELKPIIFVICNNGYTIERYVHGWDAAYNDIQPWKFTKLPEAFGARDDEYRTHQVRTKEHLTMLFNDDKFSHPEVLQLVELYLPQDDAPEVMKLVCQAAEKRNGE